MEAQQQPVLHHNDAFSLWLSITSINDPEVFALSINSHDEGAAASFLSSLQHVRSRLEKWASVGLAASHSPLELLGPLHSVVGSGSSLGVGSQSASLTTISIDNPQSSTSVLSDALPIDNDFASIDLPSTVVPRPARQRRRQLEAVNEDTERASIARQLSAQPVGCLVPAFSVTNPPKPNILRLAAAMRSPRAITQVCHLREFLRNGHPGELKAALINRNLTGHMLQEALDKGITICRQANHFANLLQRVSTWHFAKALQQSRSPIALRVSSEIINQATINSTRSRYHKTKHHGDLLDMVCGSHRGLIAFIPLFKDLACGIRDPEAQYQYQATKREFKTFQAIYNIDNSVTNVLCAIGTSFLDSCCYQDRQEFQYSNWLSQLQLDFSPASIQAMADRLGPRGCGCRRDKF